MNTSNLRKKWGVIRLFVKYPVVFFMPLLWMIVGFLEVFSASRFRAMQLKGDPTYFVQLDLFWRFLTVMVFLGGVMVRWRVLSKLIRLSYIPFLVLLIILLFTDPINGARRWFSLGPVNIHPAEFIKVVWVVVLSGMLARLNTGCKTYKEHLSKHVLPWGQHLVLILGLIFLQPDMSTAAIIAGITLLVYVWFRWERDPFTKQDILWAAIGGSIVGALGILFQPYRLQRFKVYLTLLFEGKVTDIFGAGNQIYHVLIGIARGGLLGVGLGQSRQQAGFLVETTAFTDSIAAVIFEEFGFILGGLLIFSYLLWFFRLLKLASNMSNREEGGILFGFAMLVFLQAFIHFGVNLALLPLTGVTLPFISYGGSSLLSNGLLLGIVGSILRSEAGESTLPAFRRR